MKINWMAGLTALGLAVCLAEEPKKAAESKVKQGGQPGMVIVKTPDGGLRAPTAEEYQVLTGQGGANLRSTAAPQQEVLGGGKGVRLALDPAVTDVFSGDEGAGWEVGDAGSRGGEGGGASGESRGTGQG